MLDKCISLCAKFPGDKLCGVCRQKAGILPPQKAAKDADTVGRLRQRFQNRTYKYMKVRPDAKQAQLRMPQSLRDFTRAHIARK